MQFRHFMGEIAMGEFMRSFILLGVIIPSLMRAVIRGTTALLLVGVFMTAGAGLAQAATVRCPATGILLPTVTDGDDLLIDGTSDGSKPLPGDGKCHVGSGTYHYGNVNIITTPGSAIRGTLSFDEGPLNTRIHFWASSILVEYGGSRLLARQLRGGGIPYQFRGAHHSSLWPGIKGSQERRRDNMPVEL